MAVTQVNTSSGTSGAGSSTTITLPATSLTAGNLFIAGVRWTTGAGAVSSVADTAGNTYILIKSFAGALTTTENLYAVFNCLGHASNVVTVTFTTGVTNRTMVGAQYAGAGVYPLVGSGWNSVTSGGTITLQSSHHGTDYLAVILAQNDGGGGTWTAGSGFTNAVQDSSGVLVLAEAIVATNTNLTPSMSSTLTNGKLLISASFHNDSIDSSGGVSRSRVQRGM